MKKILLLALAALAFSCKPAAKDEAVTNTFLYQGKTYSVRMSGGVDEIEQTYDTDINFVGDDTPDWMMWASGKFGTFQLPAKESEFSLSNNHSTFSFKSGTVKAYLKDRQITVIVDGVLEDDSVLKLSVRSEAMDL